MTGKTTKAVMAIFAVALMMMVAFVPAISVLTDDGSDAASGTVFSDLNVQLFNKDSDLKDLVYYGGYLNNGNAIGFPAGLDKSDFINNAAGDTYYRWADTGKLLRYGDIPGYAYYVGFIPSTEFPMIQTTGSYTSAVNAISGNVVIEHPGIPSAGSKTLTISVAADPSKIYGSVTGTREYLQNCRVTGSTDTGDLNIPVALQAGNYDVKVTATQGVTTQSVAKTLSNGTAITVSGKVVDADNNAIVGATVTMTIGGVNSTFTTKADGSYKFYVASGNVVKVAVSYADTYTFTSDSEPKGNEYSFGTVTASVTHDFKAVQHTASVKVTDASGRVVVGATVTPTWYYTKDSGNVTAVPASGAPFSSPGSAKALAVSDENGIVKVVYTVPVKAADATGTFKMYLYTLITGAPTGYTAADNSIDTTKTYNAQTLGASAKLTDISGSYSSEISVKMNEYSFVAKVTDKSGNKPVIGATVTPKWYYTKGTGNVTATDGTDFSVVGNAKALAASDKDGSVVITYLVPVKKDAVTETVTTYLYAIASGSGLVGSFDEAGLSTGKTFAQQSLASSEALVSVPTSTPSMTLKAKEIVFKISGSIEGYTSETPKADAITYSYDAATDKKATVDETGKFVIYVVKDTVVGVLKIDSVKIPGSFTPAQFDLGTITADRTCDFKKTTESPVDSTVTYTVSGVANGTKVTFSYNVSGKEYKQVVTAADTKATINVALKSTDTIKVVAAADGYKIAEFVGYTAVAKKVTNVSFMTFDGVYTANKVVGEMSLSYKFAKAGSDDVAGTFKTDKSGYVTFTVDADLAGYALYVYSGNVALTVTTVSDAASAVAGYLKGFYAVDVSSLIDKNTTVTVTVNYVDGYNGDTTLQPALIASQSSVVKYGSTVTFTAPSFEKFKFSGWFMNGVKVSDKAEYSFTANADMGDTASVYAVYSALPQENPVPGVSNAVIIIGAIAVIIALLAVAYVVIQTKKKD